MKAIVIGSGMSGLTAGAYLARAGPIVSPRQRFCASFHNLSCMIAQKEGIHPIPFCLGLCYNSQQ